MEQQKNLPWYQLLDESEADTPALFVYPERVRENIATCLSMVKDVNRLRPHLKTSKAKEPLQLMLQAGISKFKCATIAEAEMAALCKVPDLLLAYQPDEQKSHRLWQLIASYPATLFSCLVDNIETAHRLSQQAKEKGKVLPVYLDLNVGMNRTGMIPGDVAFTCYQQIAALPFLKLMGIHAYDGHIHDADMAMRKAGVESAFAPVWEMVKKIAEAGMEQPVIIAGGSPTFPIHAADERVECSPGTFIYWDYGYQQKYTEQPFLPAVVLATRIVSKPLPGHICIDAGHKAIAAENELARRLHFLNLTEYTVVSHSEEHMVLRVNDADTLPIHTLLYALPYHVCPTVALHHSVREVTGHHLTGEWETIARKRKITI